MVALIAFVLVVAGSTQFPGPTTISSAGLSALATGQAQVEIDPHVVRVECPSGTFHLEQTVTCRARLYLGHSLTRFETLRVTIHHDDDGTLSVDVKVA